MKHALFALKALTLSTILLASFACTKDDGQKKVSNNFSEVSPSCGAIDMSPANSLLVTTMVGFEVIPPTGETLNDLQWIIKKGNQAIHSTTDLLVSYKFNSVNEGPGAYVTTASFTKNNGDKCALTKSFQILSSTNDDICTKPSGISGPTIGYLNEETSPFSIDAEPCFWGQVLWDMNSDDVVDYTLDPQHFMHHTYSTSGEHTVRALVMDYENDDQITLTHTIKIIAPATYAWLASEFGKCTGACESSDGTREILNYACQKTYDGALTIVKDDECLSSIGAKPAGEKENCKVAPEDQSINCLSCGKIPHGGSVTQWKKADTCGKPCSPQDRTCNNGVIPPFDEGYTYTSESSCPISTCPPVVTYKWVTGEYGKCSGKVCGKDGIQKRTVACHRNDGVKVSDKYCTEPKPATQKTCSIPCRACILPWGGLLPHDDSVVAYRKAIVDINAKCDSQTRKCKDGKLTGSYSYKTCEAAHP